MKVKTPVIDNIGIRTPAEELYMWAEVPEEKE